MSSFYHQNRAGEVYAVTIVLLVLATLAVLLRVISRKISGARFGWDDWSIFGALVLYLGLTICYWLQVALGGLAQHAQAVGGPIDQKKEILFFKIFMAQQVLYFCSSTVFKTSLVLLYHRLFGIQYWYRRVLIVAEAIVLSYFIVFLFAAIFECRPVAYYWDKSIKGGSCVNQKQFYRWNAVASMLIDFMLLSLTFPMVWRLHISQRQKLILSGIFALGTFGCVASIVRITSFNDLHIEDSTYTAIAPALWTVVEQSLGIICACLPCMGPLLARLLHIREPNHTDGTANGRKISLKKLSPGQNPDKGHQIGGFARLPEDLLLAPSPAVTAFASADSHHEPCMERDAISKRLSIETYFQSV